MYGPWKLCCAETVSPQPASAVGEWALAHRLLVEPRLLPFLVFVRLAC